MGLSASQARYLSLTARMSNVEYQGQQINQERTILSQQCTSLYNSLLDMEVPTPPSTKNFSKIRYSGTQGATAFSIPAEKIKPGKDDTYIVTREQTSYKGGTLSLNTGYAMVEPGYQEISGTTVTSTVEFDAKDAANLYIYIGEDTVRKAVADVDYKRVGDKIYLEGTPEVFLRSNTSTEKLKKVKVEEVGTTGFTVAGYNTYTLASALEEGVIDKPMYEGYCQAIKNSNIKNNEGNVLGPEDFIMYKDNSGVVHFAVYGDLTDTNNNVVTYDYYANGQHTVEDTVENCKLTFDPASGRITSIDFPVYSQDDPTKIVGYTNVSLTAEEIYDEEAYQDAYSQYEYKMMLYDKRTQEINAKTEVIQQEDRTLELKLQRLDNERTMLKTELEACKKVIDENIQNSFKTFSG